MPPQGMPPQEGCKPWVSHPRQHPPNPYQTAAAQTGTNVSTGVANAFLNNVNQNTPEGSLRYDVTGNYDWRDPSTGQTYSIPTVHLDAVAVAAGAGDQVAD